MSCVAPPMSGNRLCGKPTTGVRIVDGIECQLCATHLAEFDTPDPLEDTMPKETPPKPIVPLLTDLQYERMAHDVLTPLSNLTHAERMAVLSLRLDAAIAAFKFASVSGTHWTALQRLLAAMQTSRTWDEAPKPTTDA